MSKIGKKIIEIPSGVDVKINGSLISVKGPKGELEKLIPNLIEVESDGKILQVKPSTTVAKGKETVALWGLTRALIANMIKGVVDGFEEALEFQGVGYKAVVKGNELELELGYSHPITITATEGISFKVEKNVIKIIGIDKEIIGKVAADIRSKRKPEPYKGSGIRYQGEIIKKKAGKKAVASGS